MVFRSPVDRVMPVFLADERGALTQQFNFHQATLLRMLDGLDDGRGARRDGGVVAGDYAA
ncbi:hypothetical protein ACGFI9_32030 [Micromonospora sp. NPDC048930]|uniref:hypothetical protein n=1 Tax=Micromonospora sp. NPDC048930 TaxID=3364261 RepID=UPI0037222280